MRALPSAARPLLPIVCLALLLSACAEREGAAAQREELAAILGIEDRRESPLLLAPFLEHPSAEVRARAARAAGRIGRSEALELLEPALGDESPAVRGEAAFALGLVDQSSEDRREAARALLPALLDAEAPVRARAVRALCRQAGVLALAGEAVEEGWSARAAALLADPEGEVRREALLGLWLFPAPVALDAVAALVGDEDPEIRWAAAYHLSRRLRSGPRVGATPVPEGLPLDEEQRRLAGSRLLAAGEDPEEEVRREAARGLGHVPGEESLRALSVLVGDSSWRVRVEALRGLAVHPELFAELLLPSMSDPSPHVRAVALAAAAVLGPGAAPLPLRSAVVDLLTDPSEEVRLAAHPAAAALLPPATYDELTADPELIRRGGAGAGDATAAAVLRGRAAALGLTAILASGSRRLGARPGGAGVEELIEAVLAEEGLLQDPELSPLAGAAAWQLLWDRLARELDSGAGPEGGEKVIEALPVLLPPPTAELPLRAAALEGLAALLGSLPRAEREKLPAALGESLVKAYAEAVGDELMDARRAALEGLALLGGEAALGVLPQAAVSEPSPWLRRRAAELAREAGLEIPPAPYETGREIADYRELLSQMARPLEARFETAKGSFEAALLGGQAPLTVASFRELARSGHFDGQRFHRVVPDFVLQGGDPRGDGYGGPGFEIRCEINPVPYRRGTLGMALAGKDTGGSQFFVTHAPQPHLDGRYTVFGRVVSGQDVVDRLTQGDRLLRVIVE